MKKTVTALFSLVTVACTLLCGCRSTDAMQGFPHNGFNTKKKLKERYTNFDGQDYEKKYYGANTSDADKLKLRNDYVHDRKALIDAEYDIFLERLSGVKNWKDLGKTVAVGTMGVVGGLVGGNPAQLLSAASGATTLSDSAVDSVFFYNATLPAMKAGMDAARATVLVKIAEGLTNNVNGYTLGAAQADLDDYYFAGTLLGAANSIQQQSAKKTAAATDAAGAVKENAKLDPNKPADKPKIEENLRKIEKFNAL